MSKDLRNAITIIDTMLWDPTVDSTDKKKLRAVKELIQRGMASMAQVNEVIEEVAAK